MPMIMTMIRIITSSDIVALIAVHSQTMYSSDSCKWHNSNSWINISVFVNVILRSSSDIKVMT